MKPLLPMLCAFALSCNGGEPYRKRLIDDGDRLAKAADGIFRTEGTAARAAYERALERYLALDEPAAVARTINNLAVLDYLEGRFEEAASRLKAAASLFERHRLAGETAEVWLNLAQVCRRQGDATGAREYESAARKLLRSSDDPIDESEREETDPAGLAARLTNAGWEQLDANDVEGALALFLRALELDRKAEDLLHVAEDLGNLGLACERAGRNGEAAEFYERAGNVNRSLGLPKRAEQDAADTARLRK